MSSAIPRSPMPSRHIPMATIYHAGRLVKPWRHESREILEGGRSAPLGVRQEQVRAVAVLLEEAVEVALAQPLALLPRCALPVAVRMALERQAGHDAIAVAALAEGEG